MHSNWLDIAEPESRVSLLKEINACELLGETPDNKGIYLLYPKAEQGYTVLLKEIGRLREEAFRLVGEGTGLERDMDSYDLYYMHIILWDGKGQQIVGAYRLCSTEYLYTDPSKPIYTARLFSYLPSAEPILKSGLELGRSFVQEKYWGSRSLDYLWSGIAAFLRRHPKYRYLLGAVSISNDMSLHAKEILVGFYQKYYACQNEANNARVECAKPFTLSEKGQTHLDELFDGLDHKQGFIATMYAMADWFSPSDTEAPTLEVIQFHSIDSYKNIPLTEIPPVIFSEIMRDIDLVVSVAHVGGVDPEASHSTMEMRGALAKASAQLFKLPNITVKERHIFIKGTLGEYTIHLGSGLVSKNGLALSIIPVHSQHRGRMFLPFVDEDPKSAEIISKMNNLFCLSLLAKISP